MPTAPSIRTTRISIIGAGTRQRPADRRIAERSPHCGTFDFTSATTVHAHHQATGRVGPILTQTQALDVGTFLFADLLRPPTDDEGEPVDELVIPILRINDAATAVTWYQRLGFTQESVHHYAPGMPAFVTIARGGCGCSSPNMKETPARTR